MKAITFVTAIVAVLITLPISMYLQYKILTLVNATELMWFLFWVNVPLLIFISFISKIAPKD